jgi:DNA-binding SARP family transcriptional activator/predicted ATPase
MSVMRKARLSISLLGSFRAILPQGSAATFESDKVRALLAYLAVEAQHAHRREKLAGLLWPDLPNQRARQNLSQALYNLRAAINDYQASPPHLLITPQTIQINPAAHYQLDVADFLDLVSASQQHAHHSLAACPACLAGLRQAAGLYQGDFLAGFVLPDNQGFEDWISCTRQQLHYQAMQILLHLAGYYEGQGRYKQAARFALRQVALEPWLEEAHRQLMRALAASGQRSAALAQYETCRRILEAELGSAPDPQTTALYEQIRDHQPGPARSVVSRLDVTTPPPPIFLDSAVTPKRTTSPVFVGRERQLERLGEFLEAALAGNGQLVFITGDAGRGKTALIDHFIQRAQAAYPDLIVAFGGCNAYTGLGDPYLPFREIMGMLTGEVEARWTAGAITRSHAQRLWNALPLVVQVLLENGPALIDIFTPGAALLARAAQAMPANIGCRHALEALVGRDKTVASFMEQQHIFEQYTNVLRGIAAGYPLLLILDDLQWVDIASISLLFHLGRRLAGNRILIIGAYRPDEITAGLDGQRHPLEKALAEFKRQLGDVWLELDQTNEAEGRRFVAALINTEPNRLPEDFCWTLYRHTQAHPLFTVELLRAMQRRGDLIRNAVGEWIRGPTLDWKTLPKRVEGIIEERIGRLNADLQRLLAIASVEGEEFTAQVVARLKGCAEQVVLRKLAQDLAGRHRLVIERGEVQIGPNHLSRFQFAHALFQQYLYQRLGAGERRLLHREVALALESLFDERAGDLAVQLAYHCAGAGDSERERRYARLAGEKAAEHFAHTEALRYLGRALELTPEAETAEHYSLRLARERIYNAQGARRAQIEDLTALADLAEQLADDRRRIEVALRHCACAERLGDYATAIGKAQTAIALAQAHQLTPAEAAGRLQWGQALWRQGAYAPAQTQLEQALALIRASGDISRPSEKQGVEAEILRNMGVVNFQQGSYANAHRYYEEALQLYRQSHDQRGEGMALNGMAILAADQGNFDIAIAHFEAALQIFRTIGYRWGESLVIGNIGLLLDKLGNYAQAMSYQNQALSIIREIGDRPGEGRLLGNLALLHHHLNDQPTALHYGRQALSILQDLGDRSKQAFVLTKLGHALVGLNQFTEAFAAYQQALELRRTLGERHLVSETLAGLARLALAQGNLPPAMAWVEEILCLLETHSLNDADEPLRIYWTCYQVLQADYHPRARTILETGYQQLQIQAARIRDEAMRRSFLNNVAVHRELAAAWEQKANN